MRADRHTDILIRIPHIPLRDEVTIATAIHRTEQPKEFH